MQARSFRSASHETLKINFAPKFLQYDKNCAGHAKDEQIKSIMIEDNDLINKERFFKGIFRSEILVCAHCV